MGILIRAGWEALRRRLAPRPGNATVCAALRGLSGISSIEAVEVSTAEHGGTLVSVELRIAQGADAHETACRAGERLQERVPAAEVRVQVLKGAHA